MTLPQPPRKGKVRKPETMEISMSESDEVNYRDPKSWIRDPADYPDYPSPRVRSGISRSSAGIAHLNNWWKFFAGLREKPPQKSGLFRPVDKDGNLYFGPQEDR